MRLRCRILCFSPEPQDRTIIAFLYVNESAFVRYGLKCLKSFHSNFRMCSFPARSRDVRHGQCRNRYLPKFTGHIGRQATSAAVMRLVTGAISKLP